MNNTSQSHMIIYTTADGLAKIETTFDGDTVWLSKSQMAELFQRDRSVISKHIRNVFEEGELSREGNVQFCTLLLQINLWNSITSMLSFLSVIV